MTTISVVNYRKGKNNMNMFFCILGIIIIIAGLVFYIFNKYHTVNTKSFLWFIVIGIVMIILSSSFTIIPTGYTGVRTTFGQIDNVTVQNGFNWKVPFIQSVATVNNKQQDIKFEEDEIWSETSERTAIQYKGITVTYQINSEKSAWIYANISDYENNLVSKSLVSSSIKSSSKTLSDIDATNRSIIEPLALKNIQSSLDEKYGKDVIFVNKVIINNADFEESYNKAIAEKQKAQLAKEQQDIVNQQNIDTAEAEAEVKLTQATAEAEAKKIEAAAEAEANTTLEKSLTDKVLKDKYLEKWNGELPKVVSDDSSLMFDIGSLEEEKE